ncbi:hypothetical protein B0H15DRAFT_465846 [Mycena belliarum]|uniref:Uncharacterized protein n=1 Tax=Mycena belliarum TaxID=1033014 RepID=A0AAD6UFT3_9AGAR|nr:hypothetical protein B0H15DRAFT_465846 [Mycena belliae]
MLRNTVWRLVQLLAQSLAPEFKSPFAKLGRRLGDTSPFFEVHFPLAWDGKRCWNGSISRVQMTRTAALDSRHLVLSRTGRTTPRLFLDDRLCFKSCLGLFDLGSEAGDSSQEAGRDAFLCLQGHNRISERRSCMIKAPVKATRTQDILATRVSIPWVSQRHNLLTWASSADLALRTDHGRRYLVSSAIRQFSQISPVHFQILDFSSMRCSRAR